MTTPEIPDGWAHTVAEDAPKPMTVGMALKLAAITRAQALEQAYREVVLMLRESDDARQIFEDRRSVRRNRNRLAVLTMGLTASILWPLIMLHVFHSSVGTVWTTAVSNTADMAVTAYALWRHY